MKNYTNEEKNLIHSLNRPFNNIDESLVSTIIDKLLDNKDFEELINFLNLLHDFAIVPLDVVDKLINDNNKECVSIFLENEGILFFLTDNEIKKLKDFLNVHEINICLDESFNYYYRLLYNQGIRIWSGNVKKINDNIVEHKLTRYNEMLNLKLKEVKGIGVIVSCIIYSNYNLSKEEQILNGIDYINEFGFNIDRDVSLNVEL